MKHWQHLTAIAFTLCPWIPFLCAAGTDLRFVPGATTWSEARSVCQGLGGDLATISNEQENLAVLSNLPSGATPAWIGGHDAGRDDMFEWVDGSLAGYSNWASGEPTHVWRGHMDEDCMVMKADGTWNDYPCSNPLGAYQAAGCICRVATGESERVRIRPPNITLFEPRIRAGDLCALMCSPCADAGSGGHAR